MSKIQSTKCSHITIVGSPNAGKSTLLNNLIGSKVSIISPKVQTTRNIINGICTFDNAQLIFIDTPGIFSPKSKLERSIVKVAWRGVNEAEQIALIIDSRKGICRNTQEIITQLSKKNTNVIVVLNKIDRVRSNVILELMDKLKDIKIIKEIFMISALTGEGVESLKKYFIANASISPWLYDEDEITTLPSKFLACEIVREQLFLNLNQEIPYNIAVECENWELLKNSSIKINLAIYVIKEGQKKIILGKHGSLIKKISINARKELENLFDKKVHLFLFVKVRENWIDNPNMLPN